MAFLKVKYKGNTVEKISVPSIKEALSVKENKNGEQSLMTFIYSTTNEVTRIENTINLTNVRK
jgi:hypothetical protein